jgi:uncharacterized protein with HEPN domain
MPRSAEMYLLDMQKAASYLIRRTNGLTLEDYLQDEDLRYAVERNFILIGEAVVLLRRNYPEVSARLDGEAGIISFRNFIVHQYWSVDNQQVWSTLITKVSPVRDAIDRLLGQMKKDPDFHS